MAEPYMGTILLWPINYAPRGWSFCWGQSVSIAEQSTLYALLGTTYGGDGRSNFNLPDLRSRVPVGTGSAPGISYPLHFGQYGGAEATRLNLAQCPTHAHANVINNDNGPSVTLEVAIPVTGDTATTATPDNNLVLALAKTSDATLSPKMYSNSTANRTSLEPFNASGTFTADVELNNVAVGNNDPIDNTQPYLAMHYIICIDGLFPPRN